MQCSSGQSKAGNTNVGLTYPLEEVGQVPSSQNLSPLHSGFSAPEIPNTGSTYAEKKHYRNVLQHTQTHIDRYRSRKYAVQHTQLHDVGGNCGLEH